jgi:hypothetical protein
VLEVGEDVTAKEAEDRRDQVSLVVAVGVMLFLTVTVVFCKVSGHRQGIFSYSKVQVYFLDPVVDPEAVTFQPLEQQKVISEPRYPLTVFCRVEPASMQALATYPATATNLVRIKSHEN